MPVLHRGNSGECGDDGNVDLGGDDLDVEGVKRSEKGELSLGDY